MAALSSDVLLSRLPIIVILGATGTGKSKLGLQIAKKFNGEIISADSMQVYKGLDIVTNKVTEEEQKIAKHHLLDFLNPNQLYTVVDFSDKALPIVDDLLKRKALPVVVGGTNYYIESLLWKILIRDENPREGLVAEKNEGKRMIDVLEEDEGDGKRMKGEQDGGGPGNDLCFDVTRLYEKLKKVDPERAAELHPNNVRKVIRSLEIFQSTGRKHSELLKEQRAAGGSPFGGPLRYTDGIIFWVQADQQVLNKRLDARVDEMISAGLIEELLDFHKRYNILRMKENKPADYTKGIFQSIGFKEFHEYLMADEKYRESEEGIKLFKKCVEEMKLATRRYSKRQIKWIRNRVLKRPIDQSLPVYGLDASNVTLWDEKVYQPAIKVLECYLTSQDCDIKPLPIESIEISNNAHTGHHFCDICERTFVGNLQWQAHLRSRTHERVLIKKDREMRMKQEEKKVDDVSTKSEDQVTKS